jgi:hypothetical protein
MVRGLEGERTTRMTVFDKKGVMACPVRGETCRLPQDIDARGLNMARFNHLKSGGAQWFEFFFEVRTGDGRHGLDLGQMVACAGSIT